MLTCFSLYFMCYLMVQASINRADESLVTGLIFLSVVLLVLGIWINSVVSLVYGIKMIVSSGWDCKPMWQVSLELAFVALGVLSMLTVIGITIFYGCRGYIKMRRERHAKKELETLFETIYDPNKNVEKLLTKYQDILEEMELTDIELRILCDAFAKIWDKDQSGVDEAGTVSCIICYMAYQVDDKVLEFPLCKHSYHNDCLTEWLVKSPRCPMCKSHARIAMIRALHQRHKG